jgi:hypothetical protein
MLRVTCSKAVLQVPWLRFDAAERSFTGEGIVHRSPSSDSHFSTSLLSAKAVSEEAQSNTILEEKP